MADILKKTKKTEGNRNRIIQDLLGEILGSGQPSPPMGGMGEGLTNIPPYQMPGGQTGQDYVNQNLNVASPAETRGFIGAQQGNPDLDVELLIKILNEEVARRSISKRK